MKKHARVFFFAVFALSMSGCFNHMYTYGSGGNMNSPPKYNNGFVSHFLFGLIGEEKVDVKAICPSGNATVKDYSSFVNGLIGSLVGIVYYPQTIEVYCDGGATAAIPVAGDQMLVLATNPRTFEDVAANAPEDADRLAQALIQYESSL